jgi:hypothetical protein
MEFNYTTGEKLKINAGAVAPLVIVGWLAVVAIGRWCDRRGRLTALPYRNSNRN